ncbi:MAG: thioesterase [Oscillospiraceae bacterium]|nr:thioesterase [Oscillospiraceae bacterium]
MDLNIYEKTFRVGAGESDPSSYCRPSALQGFLQETATVHAEILGASREDLLSGAGLFWVMVRSWYALSRPLQAGETITVRTWHRGARGAQLYRDYDIVADGVLAGEAVSAWVLVDWETRRIARPSAITALERSKTPHKAKAVLLDKLPPASGLTWVGQRRAVYSDLDVNNHVNNVRYTDYICDALRLENRPGAWMTSLQVGFTAQVLAGETLHLYTGRLSDGRFFISGRDEQEKPRFEAAGRLSE